MRPFHQFGRFLFFTGFTACRFFSVVVNADRPLTDAEWTAKRIEAEDRRLFELGYFDDARTSAGAPTGFRNVYLVRSSNSALPSTNPPAIVVLEFPQNGQVFGFATLSEWTSILNGALAKTPPGFLPLGSDSDIRTPGETTRYDLGPITALTDDDGLTRYSVTFEGGGSKGLLYRENKFGAIVGQTGDLVPRGQSHPFTGESFDEFGPQALFSSETLAFIGTGRGFSGVYLYDSKNVSQPISIVAENFFNDGNTLGAMASVAFDKKGDLYFTTEKGIYRSASLGVDPVALVVPTGTEYAPGKKLRSPSWMEIDGNRMTVQALDATFQAAVFGFDLTNGTITYVAGADTTVPSGEGKFSAAQRPLISNGTYVYEMFRNFDYDGFWSKVNGVDVPVVRRGDVIDGKKVRLAASERGSFAGNLLGLTLYFDDNSSAPYIFTLSQSRSGPRFVSEGTIGFSPVTGFHGEFSGSVGSSYIIQYQDLPGRDWLELARFNSVPGTPVPFVDPDAVKRSARLYRIATIQ